MKNTQGQIENPPYSMQNESGQLTFRLMGFGTYGTHVKTFAILAIILGGLFVATGVAQLLKVEDIFVPLAFCIFGTLDVALGIRLWLTGMGIEKAQQYRVEHRGAHPKDTVYVYDSSSLTLTKNKNETSQVLVQGSAPTYAVRKTSSHGGFAGFLFTLNWQGGSAIVMLGQDEEEKREIEQALQSHGIQGS